MTNSNTNTTTLTTRTIRLVGRHHVTTLENCPPLVQRLVLSQWRGGDSGIGWSTILRWIQAAPVTQPVNSGENWGKLTNSGAYTRAVTDGVLTWAAPPTPAKVVVPSWDALPDVP